MRSIKEWQRDAHALAVEKGFHSRECSLCRGFAERACPECGGHGRIPVDPHSPTRIAASLALIHCEISEAVECVARGGLYMELHWYDTKTKALITKECAPYDAFLTDPTKRARFPEYKPEGFPIELADVFLRLFDLAESVGANIRVPRNPCRLNACETPEEIAAELSKLHALTSNLSLIVTQPVSGASDLFGRVYRKLNAIANAAGVDLLAMAELKHEFNKTRPIMHGKCL